MLKFLVARLISVSAMRRVWQVKFLYSILYVIINEERSEEDPEKTYLTFLNTVSVLTPPPAFLHGLATYLLHTQFKSRFNELK